MWGFHLRLRWPKWVPCLKQLVEIGACHGATFLGWSNVEVASDEGPGVWMLAVYAEKGVAGNQRLENWNFFRAFFWPYFLRSTIRGSRVVRPSALRVGLSSSFNSMSALEMARRRASA